jgi:hypothetical protein
MKSAKPLVYRAHGETSVNIDSLRVFYLETDKDQVMPSLLTVSKVATFPPHRLAGECGQGAVGVGEDNRTMRP